MTVEDRRFERGKGDGAAPSTRSAAGERQDAALATTAEHLTQAAERALQTLGQGFLTHPSNESLRLAVARGELSAAAYLRQLVCLIYRCIFLLMAEPRALLHSADAAELTRQRYAADYALTRLWQAPPAPVSASVGLWRALQRVFQALQRPDPELGLRPLAGIFEASWCPTFDLPQAEPPALDDAVVLTLVAELCWLEPVSRRVPLNWHERSPEVLGDVYECLLELVPEMTPDGRGFTLRRGLELRAALDQRQRGRADSKGHSRRRSASYYTPDKLVQVLLDAALEPVIAETLARHADEPLPALLALALVDPACGSGHFLLAAARRLATHVARLSSEPPSAEAYRAALQRVIRHCIYGVDLDPLAVELCRMSLWLEAREPTLPLTFLDRQIQQGNALLGATPELLAQGIPDAAWRADVGAHKGALALLRKRNKRSALVGSENTARAVTSEASAALRATPGLTALLADVWCAAFVWPKHAPELLACAPSHEIWRDLLARGAPLPKRTGELVRQLAGEYSFFHWHLRFPQIFSKAGFDVVLGNPPWIAHAGRAAQALPSGMRTFFQTNHAAFADYPTTHGMFVALAATLLRSGGRLGLVVPSSLSELGGYAATRRAHDSCCEFEAELRDFGEGQFGGVTQPCMALVSRRSAFGRRDAAVGAPWPVARPELDATARALMARLAELPTLPPGLFGERGLQSDKKLLQHFAQARAGSGRFSTPIREGSDVREFLLLPARLHVDRAALGNRLRSAEEFGAVPVVIRQTARYPIAALSDGLAFRNSLLAGFELPAWPAAALVALLNSALLRWFHYVRFRDARQPILPQLKIGHLRALPQPLSASRVELAKLADFTEGITRSAALPSAGERAELDAFVFELYALSAEERALVSAWHDRFRPAPRPAARSEIAEH